MKSRLAVFCFITLAGLGLFAQSQITIDGSFIDWQYLPDLVAFSSAFSPVYFNRELNGQNSLEKIDKSLYWTRGGTDLREMKSFVDGTSIYFYFESFTAFSDELSIFLYPYSNRDAATLNQYTIEIIPSMGSRPSLILIWERDRVIPHRIGQISNSSIRMECAVSLEELPLLNADIETLSFDITTCYHEQVSGLFEEFFFTTIFAKDAIQKRDLE